VIKYLIGMVGALGGMFAGAWLILAPFALAYQPSGAEWADPTYVDFWTGLALLVISLFGLVMYIVGLTGELRRRGIVEAREAPEAQQVQAAGMPLTQAGGVDQVGSKDIEQILLPLVTAMLKDMQDQRQREENGGAPQGGGAPQSGGTSERRFEPETRAQR
jgi:hypothetical protein